MCGFSLILIIAVFVPLSAISAQQPPPLTPGERVRVTAPIHGVEAQVATFVALDSSSLRVKHNANDIWPANGAWWEFDGRDSILVLPRSSVRLDVWDSRSRLVEGSVSGLLLGGAVGWAIWRPRQECVRRGLFDVCREYQTVEGRFGPMVAAAAGGAVIGAIIGGHMRALRWYNVSLDEVRVSFAPRRNGFALGVRVAF